MVNYPINQLLELLDKVSGDFVELDRYIETKDQRILWTAEEDDLVRRGGADLAILKRYRGASVDLRKKYLGI